jgi:secondary thiamine-phosphate synthase enzyme
MKSHTAHLSFHTKKRHEFVYLTDLVQDEIRKSGVREGMVLVNSMHITSSVFINDNESGLKQDFLEWLEKLAPQHFDYHHHQTGEDNGYAHLWRTVMGREVVVAITNGHLDLGPWEAIFYGEFDGQRNKRVMVKIIGE